jgi:hypothetical protein
MAVMGLFSALNLHSKQFEAMAIFQEFSLGKNQPILKIVITCPGA